MTPDQLRMVALHESGHAMCLLSLRNRALVSVSLLPLNPFLADKRQRAGVCRQGDVSFIRDRRDRLYADLVVCYGGRAAERIVYGGEPPYPNWSDAPNAFALARQLVESESHVAWMCVAAYREAVKILERPDRWPAVEALAEELLKRKRLTGKEAWTIARAALAKVG